MKILLTGGGTGGHFYPTIAVAEEIKKLTEESKLDIKLYYMGPVAYDAELLSKNKIIFIQCTSGKIRKYFSIKNFFDFFKILFGTIQAFIQIFILYPDVVFCKGGYASFPPVLAAWFFRIPIVVHESDTSPGRVNKFAALSARRIAISFPDAAQYFVKAKTALTGNPIRKELITGSTQDAYQFFSLDKTLPIILILGGSQGAQVINDVIVNVLPDLVTKYQIIHQTGKNNFDVVKESAALSLVNSPSKEFQNRYKPYGTLDVTTLKMAYSVANIAISRAGSTIFEIAFFGIPSIIIPIPETISHDQRQNAYSYARGGAASVIDENNLSAHILISELERISSNPAVTVSMKTASKAFAQGNAAELIAKEILSIAREH